MLTCTKLEGWNHLQLELAPCFPARLCDLHGRTAGGRFHRAGLLLQHSGAWWRVASHTLINENIAIE